MDYHIINSMTVKNKYPLPLIQDPINCIHQAKYFTKYNVQWGFNNMHIKEGDKWKAAFKTELGLFEPTVMFFGLTNSPATFQTFMNHILDKLIYTGCVIVYLNDILIFTKTQHAHQLLNHAVLKIL